MKDSRFSICRSLVLSCILASVSLATVILPNGTVAVSGTTAAARPELAGLILQDTLVNWSDMLGTTFGTLQTRVVQEFGSGTLDFYYRIFNNPQSATFVSAGRFEDYTGFNTDVDFRLDGLGDVGPFQVKRAGTAGASVNFVFNSDTPSVVAPGHSSLFLLVKTDAVNYTTSQGDLVIGPDVAGAPSGDLSNLFTVWAPANVPEPGSYAMIAAGLAILGLAGRRRAQHLQSQAIPCVGRTSGSGPFTRIDTTAR